MLDGKFQPNSDVAADIQVKLECLRHATEFGVENDRRDPIPIAIKYYNWCLNKNSKRQSEKIAKKKV